MNRKTWYECLCTSAASKYDFLSRQKLHTARCIITFISDKVDVKPGIGFEYKKQDFFLRCRGFEKSRFGP